jgi:hypothetical protein
MPLTTAGQFGPEALIDSRTGDPLPAGTTVTAPAGYTATFSGGNVTVTGPPADAVPVTITPPGGTAQTVTVTVPPAASELAGVADLARAAVPTVTAEATYVPAVIVQGDGVDPTGATQSTAAINTKISEASALGTLTGRRIRVVFPDGVYLTDGILVKKNVWLDFGNALIKKASAGGTVDTNSVLRAVPVLTGTTYYGTYRNIKITGGTFTANGFAVSAHIINLVYCEDLEMTGVKVIHDPAALIWAFHLGGRRLTLTDLQVRGGTEVFQDGLHILHGQDITINGGHFASGDDAIALGGEPTDVYLAADPDPIRRVTISGVSVESAKAHGLRLYVQATANGPLWEVTDVAVSGLVGRAGIGRNGGVAITGHLSSTDGDFMVKRITLDAVTLDVGSTAHDGTNSYGLYAQTVSGLSVSDLRMQITEGSAAVAGFDFIVLRDSQDVLLTRPYHRKALPRRYGIDVRTCARVTVESPSLRGGAATIAPINFRDVPDAKVLGGEITNVRNGTAGITVNSGTTTTLTVRDLTVRHAVAGLSSGYAVEVTAAAVAHLTLGGNDFSGAFAPVDLTVLRSLASTIVKGNRGLVDLTVPNDRPFHRVLTARARLDALGAQTATLSETGQASPGGSFGALGVFYLDPADWPTSGKVRLRVVAVTNTTAPAATFTVGLYPVTTSGGGASAVTVTLGTAVTTAAIPTPAASSQTTAVSGEIAVPAAGFYTLAVVIDTTMAANSSVMLRATAEGRPA